MNAVKQYIEAIKTKLLISPAITSFSIVAERTLMDRGYFRARLELFNGDFLEVSEFFIVQAGICVTQEYRYQWMDSAQSQLVKRWDNATHFPGLTNFPHHIHNGSEIDVIPGDRLSIIELIESFEGIE